MKRLILSALSLFFAVMAFAGNVIVIHPPITNVSEQSIMTSSKLKRSSSLKTTTSTVYYPVSAYVDEVALTVTFTQPVGTANVMVYDANGQLVEMTTVDTNSAYEAVLSTELWASGAYTLVISYGSTTLSGSFNF